MLIELLVFLLVFLLGWPLLGLLVIGTVSVVHLYRAEKKGYMAISYWYGNFDNIRKDTTFKRVMLGLYIWPVRLVQFIKELPDIYNKYSDYEWIEAMLELGKVLSED